MRAGKTGIGAFLGAFLGRQMDRRMRRPAGLVSWVDDAPPVAMTTGLAFQHVAIQSVYFVVPVASAFALSSDPAEVTRFLCLSILAMATWQVLQLLTRGPVGSGYPIPGTHTAAMLGAYALTGAAGGGFHAAGAMVLAAGLAAIALTFVMQRLRVLLPNEVAGVVVMLIGVSLVGLATRQLGLQPGGTPAGQAEVAVLLASLATMAGVALSRTRAAPFAVLTGTLLGLALALFLDLGAPDAAAVLAARPWVALPEPWAPDFAQVTPAPMIAFLLALVAMRATAAGSLVVVQRAADAGWTRPDAPPIRRGLLADALAVTAAGALGGTAPGPATAAVGLSIANGTLARRIVWAGVPLLLLVALCPKLAALFVLIPPPVKAAMLFYVAGLLMAQGCQLTAVRLLDTRRSLVVACGLAGGVAVASAPQAFVAALPALASPLSFGAVLAFLANFVTLPLVTQRAELRLPLDGMAGRKAADWFAPLGGAWSLKPATARLAEQALVELAEILIARGVPDLAVSARRAEDRVEITLAWTGARLPDRPPFASAEDLAGPVEAQERFAVWLATREAQDFLQRSTETGCEARLAFED